MYRLFLVSLIAVITFITYQQTSFADCNVTGMTPAGGDIVVCDTTPPNPDTVGVDVNNVAGAEITVQLGAGIDTAVGEAIEGSDFDDVINIFGNLANPDDIVRSTDTSAINSRLGNDQLNIDGSLIVTSDATGINSNSGNDILNISNSRIETPNDSTINTNSGDDTLTITNTEINGGSSVNLNVGNDIAVLENTEINISSSTSINLNIGDDILTLKSGVVLNGEINCGSGDDTLVFAMDVPEEAVQIITSQILTAGLPDGSITINELFYEWTQCELLIADLNGVRTKPIPTLSEWGLIAMASILGIVGFMVIRRRKATA